MDGKSQIGIFDSGLGGLTIFKDIISLLPEYDYIYLGDVARVPYGNRSFETVHNYTWQCVQHLFNMDCALVILACNTASAKALRTIQQKDLPLFGDSQKRVLGVIRPTTESIGDYSTSNKVGVFATKGTVASMSYVMEIQRFFPEINVFQQACPMWVPLIENNEHLSKGADYFIQKYTEDLFSKCAEIDTIILGCTHYPLLIDKIRTFCPPGVSLLSQGPIVAKSLASYLKRHSALDETLSKNARRCFYSTDNTEDFNKLAQIFLDEPISSNHLSVH